jgi:hypothetical protein
MDLRTFQPDKHILLDQFRQAVTDPMLEQIARTDYALHFEEYLTALKTLVRTGHIPEPLPWCPREVLELTMWNEPSPLTPDLRTFHLTRGFAAVVLAFAYPRPETHTRMGGGINSVVAQLLESSFFLQGAYIASLPSFLAQLYHDLGQLPQDEVEQPFLLLALLLAVYQLDGTDPRLGDLANHLLEGEKKARAEARQPGEPFADEFLFGLTRYHARFPKWRHLVQSGIPEDCPFETLRLIRAAIIDSSMWQWLDLWLPPAKTAKVARSTMAGKQREDD